MVAASLLARAETLLAGAVPKPQRFGTLAVVHVIPFRKSVWIGQCPSKGEADGHHDVDGCSSVDLRSMLDRVLDSSDFCRPLFNRNRHMSLCDVL
jgi:hypothetical protein